MQPLLATIQAQYNQYGTPVLAQVQAGFTKHGMPVIQSAYDWAAPHVTHYIPTSINHVVATSSLGGTFAGHVIARFVGEQVGFTSSVALAYVGAELMESESTKALLIAAGLQLLPSIIKRVASDVLSTAIIGAGKFGIDSSISLVKLPLRAISGVFSGTNENDLKIAKQKRKIEQIKAQILKLTEENITLARQNNELKAEIAKRQALKAPEEPQKPTKEVEVD